MKSTMLEELDYPDGDGEPMAESDWHRQAMTRSIEILDAFVSGYVAGNNFIYFERGNPAAAVSPDVYVVTGVAKGPRRSYFLWREGVVPQVVIEATSASTRGVDEGRKRELYERLGVREYYLYDPLGEWLRPRLRGYRLEGGRYLPMADVAQGGLLSDELGLRLVVEGERLEFYKRASGQRLLDAEERAAMEARARREAEQRVAASEARIAELEARLHNQIPPNQE